MIGASTMRDSSETNFFLKRPALEDDLLGKLAFILYHILNIMEGLMHWLSLEKIWTMSGRKKDVKVRFNDWSHQIKYFTIMGESSDGKRFVGILDSGEKMSFSKKSRGWSLYMTNDESQTAHAV